MFFTAALNATRTTMMKMASASTVFLLLLCCPAVTPAESQCDKYAVVGKDFVVPLDSKEKDPFQLKWRHNLDVIFSRRAGVFKLGTAEDIDGSGALRLRNLTVSQSGTYTPEVFDKEGKSKTVLKPTSLCVIDGVSEPRVVVKCEEGDEKVTFACTLNTKDLPQKNDLTVLWYQNDKDIGKKKNWTLTYEAKKVEKDKFACQISNRAISARSQAITHTCSKPGFPQEVWGISVWVFVGGGGGVVLVLIFVVIICCIRTQRMKRMRLKEEGELRLEWANTGHHHHHHHGHHHNQRNQPGHHHHHHHHHHQQQQQQQPAGHTGPRPSSSRQNRNQERIQLPKTPNSGQPLPTPRRAPAKGPRPAENDDTEQPPPLPHPRTKVPRAQRV